MIDTVVLSGNSDTWTGKALDGDKLTGPESELAAVTQWAWVRRDMVQVSAVRVMRLFSHFAIPLLAKFHARLRPRSVLRPPHT